MNASVALYFLFVFLNWHQTSAKGEALGISAKLRPIKRPKPDSHEKLRLMTSSSSSPEDKLQVITKFEFRNATHEERLLAFLFQDYEPVARAVLDVNKTVEVSVSFVLLRIHGLEERNQVLTTTGLIIAEWVDERLVWEPEKFGHVKDVILKSEMVWLPELAVMNGAEELMPDFDRIRILLSHTGQLHWEPGGIFRTTCDIDIAYFPFDVQTCPILIGAYSYYSNRMNISAAIDYISTYGFQENGEWQVEDTGATRNLTILDCCPGNGYSHVVFTLQLRRRCRFYLMNIVLPCIMLSTLIMVGFFLPPEAGEKISLGISVLLAFTVFLLMIADNIPRTSLAIPLIVVYLMTTMTLGTISICMTVLVLNVHHRDPRTARLSPLMRSLVLIHTARLLSISTAHSRNFNKNLKRLEAEKACQGHVQRSGYSPANISNYWKENFQKMSKTKSINGEPLIKDLQNNDGPLKQFGKQKSPKSHTLATDHRGEARPFTNPSFCMDKPSILSVESDNEWVQAVYPLSKEAKEGMRAGKHQTNLGNPFLINNIWKKRHSTGENDMKLAFEEHQYSRTNPTLVKQKHHFQAPQIRANGMLPMSTSCRPDNQHKLTTKNSLNAREDLKVEMIGLSDRSKPIKRLSKSNSSSRQNLKPNNNNNDNNENNLRTNTNCGLKQNHDDNQLWCRRRQMDECLDKTNNIDFTSNERSSGISIDLRLRSNISPNLNRKGEAKHIAPRKKGYAIAPSEDDDDFNRDVQSLADVEEITIQDEWKDLVRVLDRLFFWLICTLMTLSSLLILLYPMYAPATHK